ncbi:BTAD domain-containing putative transcriptional regulator [Cellulomonas sp. URHD0024]|uniref:BTAD domain-containing putative transcriptional regulator n=1 Tax=Cellulomonas sp. URHD0024 TaxID=1302620 RepID=UPI0004245F95|nr:BTAD domain-containing putative transcriptional regulator [Cellulomonas sp. URHD0024]
MSAGITLLGPVALVGPDGPVHLAGRLPRAVLARLALSTGRVVATSALVDDLWPDAPPARAVNALQVYVAGLRKSLAAAGLDGALATVAPGYRLDVPARSLDIARVRDGRRAATAAARAGDVDGALVACRTALGEWRGEPFADLLDLPFARVAATAWQTERVELVEELAQHALSLGRLDGLVHELEQVAADNPVRERLWGQLALALYRRGDQVGALAAVRTVKERLAEDLGIDPGPELRDLEVRILRQGESLVGGVAGPARGVASSISTTSAQTVAHDDLQVGSAQVVMPDGTVVPLVRVRSLIGRQDGCHIRVRDSDVSRRHAAIVASAGGHALEDLGSTNGSYVNGVLVDRQVLADGDRIEVGNAVLRYHAVSP